MWVPLFPPFTTFQFVSILTFSSFPSYKSTPETIISQPTFLPQIQMAFLHLLSLTILLFFTSSVSSTIIDDSDNSQPYIVRIRNDLKPSAFSDVEKWYKSTLHSLTSYHLTDENPTPVEHSDALLHVYRTVFHGFSAKLTPKQAQELKTRPEVLTVFPDRLRQLHITRSPEFLGLSSIYNPVSLLSESAEGSNVVIGVLDTGIWPERDSFRDDDLEPIPSSWKGECEEGEKFTKEHCNKKIIGARFFLSGY